MLRELLEWYQTVQSRKLRLSSALNYVGVARFSLTMISSAVANIFNKVYQTVQLFCDSNLAMALAFSARLSEMRAGTMVFERMLLRWIFLPERAAAHEKLRLAVPSCHGRRCII